MKSKQNDPQNIVVDSPVSYPDHSGFQNVIKVYNNIVLTLHNYLFYLIMLHYFLMKIYEIYLFWVGGLDFYFQTEGYFDFISALRY